MGALIGLLFGTGLLLVWESVHPSPTRRRRAKPTIRQRLQDLLAQAGIEAVTPLGLLATCLGVAAVTWLALAAVSRSPVIATAFAVIAGYSPLAVVRMRQRSRRSELREVWPEAVDNLASAVRAGLSLPEALGQLGMRGPEPLRPAFERFAADHRATGRFDECLDRLKMALADPVGDRIVESLRMAREVGGSDLGGLLRTLSAFLREDARTRAELETRQGVTVNGARLAVSAPWLVLLLLATRPETADAYNSTAGLVVLAGGGALCFVAYRAMVRIGRLPEEERVLR